MTEVKTELKTEVKVELVDLVIDRPIMINGKALGWEYEEKDGKRTAKFTGVVKQVTKEIADDLMRMQKDAQASDMARLANNGKSIDAAPGGISVGGN